MARRFNLPKINLKGILSVPKFVLKSGARIIKVFFGLFIKLVTLGRFGDRFLRGDDSFPKYTSSGGVYGSDGFTSKLTGKNPSLKSGTYIKSKNSMPSLGEDLRKLLR